MTENKYKNILLLILVLSVLAVGAVLTARYIRLRKELQTRVEEVTAEETVFPTESELVGDYTICLSSDSDKTYTAGYIEVDQFGIYILHLLSEYQPRTLAITVGEDGSLHNAELGSGAMKRNRSLGKTTITFIKENAVCTLTK